MAFGNPSSSSQKFEYDLNRNQIMGFSVLAIEQLGWGIFKADEDTLMGEVPIEGVDNIYLLDITAEPQKLLVKSSISQGIDENPEVNGQNISKFIEQFNLLKDTIAKEEAAERFIEFREYIESEENKTKPSLKERLNEAASLFIPTKEYFFTPIIAILNIIIFIVMILSGVDFISPSSEAIINWGGNFAPLTLGGEWWRLLTANFLHIGIIHLAFNMWVLLFAGDILEPQIGRAKFLLAYLLTGLSSSVLSLFFHSNNVSAGASGAIFGLFGVLLILLLTSYVDKRIRKSILANAVFFIVANLLYGVGDNIDNAGHIGGLIGGCLLGLAFYPLLIKKRESVVANGALVFIAITFIAICVVGLNYAPQNDTNKFNKLSEEFIALETEAVEVYSMFETEPVDDILNFLDEKGIANWEQGQQIAKEMQTLNIESREMNYAKILEEYCGYRIELYRLFKKAIKEETEEYDNLIELNNAKVDSLLGEVK